MASLAAAGVAVLVVGGCGAATSPDAPAMSFPSGLADDHVVFAVDYTIDHPAMRDVYDPRWLTLTADGTLVRGRPDTDATLPAVTTKLTSGELARIWAMIMASGVATDGDLPLPGFIEMNGATATVFRVDDGTHSTRLTIHVLGGEDTSEASPTSPAEIRLRKAAIALEDQLYAIGGTVPWVPPALLVWWRTELPGDWDAKVVSSPIPMDLSADGHAIEHAVWSRCARLDGDRATSTARYAHALPVISLVEQAGVRYAITVRAIHPDELDTVACPEPKD